MIKHIWNISLYQQIYAFWKTQMERFLNHCTQDNEVTAFYCKAPQHFSEKSHLAFFLTKWGVFPDTTVISYHRLFQFAASENLADFNQAFLPFLCPSISFPGQTLLPCESSWLAQLLTSINMHLLHLPGNWQVLGNEGESRLNQNQTLPENLPPPVLYAWIYTRKIPTDPDLDQSWASFIPLSQISSRNATKR